MRIILDPHMHSCDVWFSDGNLQILKDLPEENCAKIVNFVINKYVKSTGEQIVEQAYEVSIDDFGVGRWYRLQLENMGVKVIPITREKRIL